MIFGDFMDGIRVVFFDFYYTLFRPVYSEREALEKFFDDLISYLHNEGFFNDRNLSRESIEYEFNKSIGFFEMVREATLFDLPVDSLVKMLTSRLCIFDVDVINKIIELYTNALANSVEPYPEAKKILSFLKNAGFKIGLISNVQQYRFVDRALKNYGLDMFDLKVYSGIVGVRKPHRAIFEYAINKINVEREEALMVGDRFIEDFYGAINAGLRAILLVRDRDMLNVYRKYLKDDVLISSLIDLKDLL